MYVYTYTYTLHTHIYVYVYIDNMHPHIHIHTYVHAGTRSKRCHSFFISMGSAVVKMCGSIATKSGATMNTTMAPFLLGFVVLMMMWRRMRMNVALQ